MRSRSGMPTVGSMPLDIATRFAAIDTLSDADHAAWSALAARALEPNPFFEPEFVIPAARIYPGVELLLIEAPGRLIGALPVRRAARWRKLPAPVLWAWRHQDAYLGTPLIDPEAPDEAIAGLLDAAFADRRSGLLVLEWYGTGGPLDDLLQTALADRGVTPLVYESIDRAALTRRADGGYLKTTVSNRRLRELRRLRRQMTEVLESHVEVTNRAGDPAAVEGFLQAEASGWKGRAGTDFASSEAYANFFREICANLAAVGRLELLVMCVGGVDVAWKVNIVSGDAVFCFKIAHDEEFGRFSPGVQLELDNVETFHRGTAAWSDSCADPDNEMINRLWPDRRELATLLVPTGGVLGAASKQSARMFMAARKRIRRTDEQAA